jgi:alkylated DNA repair dioxygenase AlkB
MNSFFNLNSEEKQPACHIKGLTIFEDFINEDEEQFLISMIDKEMWHTQLLRRVQHYGSIYNYYRPNSTKKVKAKSIPVWLSELANKVYSTGLLRTSPDQIIINEYIPGQGISAHIDCPIQFGDTICSISLEDSYVMTFENSNEGIKEDVLLKRRSLIILSEDARYRWTHKISSRKNDYIGGFKKARSRRVSITFRTRLLGDKE